MNIVFMGTPLLGRVCLQALIDSKNEFNVAAVITQPDRPAGRGKKLVASPVKELALEAGIPCFQPVRVNRGDFPALLASLSADIFVVAAFGQILSQKVLDTPKFGAINVHASLLPKYRGAAPIQQAILDGETVTGITIMKMDKGMDTGDMLLKREVPITPCDTGGSLHDKLCEIAPSALLDGLRQIAEGSARFEKQDDSKATYAPMITKEMARIDWSKSPDEIVNLIRGYNPFPGAYGHIDGTVLKIWRAAAAPSDTAPVLCPKEGIFVQAKDGIVQILELTPAGGKKMTAAEYVRGRK
jgi:methionyl-tRNA formyltransferase